MKKLVSISLFIFFCVVLFIVIVGLFFYKNKTNINTNNNINVNNLLETIPSGVILSSSEVLKHNTNTDCWIIVNNKVYNISNYASSHSGGVRNVTNYCGKEGTVAFDTKGGRGKPHSNSANNMLDKYYIGDLK